MKKAVSILLAAVMMAVMGVSVFADNFVPSIEQKPAPDVVEVKENGQPFGAIIIDGKTEVTEEGVPMYDKNASSTILEFFVISAAEKEQAALPEITENVTQAQEEVSKAENIGKLEEGIDTQIKQAIDEFYGDSEDKPEINDLVITDLFDASLVRDKAKLEQVAEGQKIRFMLRPNFTKGDFFVVLHYVDETHWEVVNDVEWTEDGALIVTVDKLSVFAFVREKSVALPVDPSGPSSPLTGDEGNIVFLYAGIAVLCIGFAAFFFVKAQRKTA